MSEEKKGLFSRLKEGLTKTRNNIVAWIPYSAVSPILMKISMKNWKKY